MIDVTNLRIEMYADGADFEKIKILLENPLVKGFTTNPTLMRSAGISDYESFATEVAKLVYPLPVSLEVFADDFSEMKVQAKKLIDLGSNVFVKIPITNTKGESSIDLIRELSLSGANLNITAVFTDNQVKSILNCLSHQSNTIISIFAGRIADAGFDPMPIIERAIENARHLPNVKILWASPREIYNLVQAENLGCHIITMTPDLWKKIDSIGKDLSQFSLETVRMFFNDATSSGFKF